MCYGLQATGLATSCWQSEQEISHYTHNLERDSVTTLILCVFVETPCLLPEEKLLTRVKVLTLLWEGKGHLVQHMMHFVTVQAACERSIVILVMYRHHGNTSRTEDTQLSYMVYCNPERELICMWINCQGFVIKQKLRYKTLIL
jgi:hypothetical protein